MDTGIFSSIHQQVPSRLKSSPSSYCILNGRATSNNIDTYCSNLSRPSFKVFFNGPKFHVQVDYGLSPLTFHLEICAHSYRQFNSRNATFKQQRFSSETSEGQVLHWYSGASQLLKNFEWKNYFRFGACRLVTMFSRNTCQYSFHIIDTSSRCLQAAQQNKESRLMFSRIYECTSYQIKPKLQPSQ